MVSFENFVKSMPPSLSELKVIPSFCFAFKIPDDVTASSMYVRFLESVPGFKHTAIPYRESTGFLQGFPCVVILPLHALAVYRV